MNKTEQQAMNDDLTDRVEQIRRAHAQAKPKDSNPAWKNCHHDMAVMFDRIAELEHQLSEAQSIVAHDYEHIEMLERQLADLQQKLADFTKGVSVKIPTVTMEQEFQAHYRRGFEARKLAAVEPVLYQARMRPNWLPDGEGWTEWKDCSHESYEDREKLSKLPHYNSWEYEVRKLYAAPQPQAAQKVRELIADDDFALSFQSIGQYRQNLISFIDRCILDAEPKESHEQY